MSLVLFDFGVNQDFDLLKPGVSLILPKETRKISKEYKAAFYDYVNNFVKTLPDLEKDQVLNLIKQKATYYGLKYTSAYDFSINRFECSLEVQTAFGWYKKNNLKARTELAGKVYYLFFGFSKKQCFLQILNESNLDHYIFSILTLLTSEDELFLTHTDDCIYFDLSSTNEPENMGITLKSLRSLDYVCKYVSTTDTYVKQLNERLQFDEISLSKLAGIQDGI